MATAVKPWGNAYLVGSTIGSLVMGIGLRNRETIVEIYEKRDSPHYERLKMGRCVVPYNSIRLLTDIGVTQTNLMRILRPAKRWKFVNHLLETMREGDTYPSCAPSEPVYHTTDGEMLRMLRQDFVRFGGVLAWQTEAYQPFETGDVSGLWSLRKDWGTVHDAEVIVSFAKASPFFHERVFERREKLRHAAFESRSGVVEKVPDEVRKTLGKDFDFIIVLARELAMHIWQSTPTSVAWNCYTRPGTDTVTSFAQLHPALRILMSNTPVVRHDRLHAPLECPRLQSNPNDISRVTVMGDALLPVDIFSWRGDSTLLAIEEASTLCKKLFTRQFHRAHLPSELRQAEQESLVKRFNFVLRDLKDTEMFLSLAPELPKEEEGEPEPAKVAS